MLGLSADPPHCGHLEMARLLLRKNLADEVWLIPCYKHSFGKLISSSYHRWQMTKLLEGKGIRADNTELLRKGNSYTVDTVRELKEKYPDYRFSWVMGSDLVKSKSFLRWKNWQTLSSLIDFLVVLRKGYKIKKMPAGFTLVAEEVSDISSSEVRERIRLGLPIKGLVPRKVEEYIKEHNLYSFSKEKYNIVCSF